jgi:hypothetical protein
MYIYLDWNVFDRIEKIASLTDDERNLYEKLEKILVSDETVCPYSNAHLNDLLRGFNKNPSYTPNHLDILAKLTKNLCICQYWSNSEVTWHTRPVHEFFDDAIEEKESESETFEELVDHDISGRWEVYRPFFDIMQVPASFKQIYQVDPLFNIIYPRTRAESTMSALCADLYHFSLLLNKDFSIYQTFKRFLILTMNKLQKDQKLLKMAKQTLQGNPKYLSLDTIVDQVTPKSEVSKNESYGKIIDVFYRYDLMGYKTDSRFQNMGDDALHTFYGAQCDYFITNDDKCQYKSQKTYERLGITTEVLTAIAFVKKTSTD